LLAPFILKLSTLSYRTLDLCDLSDPANLPRSNTSSSTEPVEPSHSTPHTDHALLNTRKTVAVKALATPPLALAEVMALRMLMGGGKGRERVLVLPWQTGECLVVEVTALSIGVLSGRLRGGAESAKRRVGTRPYNM
jgi:hypothetical protein